MKFRISPYPTLVSIVILTMLFSASLSVSSEYLPLDQGLEWTYTDNVVARVGVADDINGTMATPLEFWWPQFNGVKYWFVDDAEGPMLVDVTVHDSMYDGHEWFLESWSLGMETPVRLFNLPLTPGAQLFDVISSDMGTSLGFFLPLYFTFIPKLDRCSTMVPCSPVFPVLLKLS